MRVYGTNHRVKYRKARAILEYFRHLIEIYLIPWKSDLSSGINKWRDARTPRQILDKYCETNNFHKPKFMGNNKVIFHGDAYWLEDFGKCGTCNP